MYTQYEYLYIKSQERRKSDGDEEWPRRRRANWCSTDQASMSLAEEEPVSASAGGYERRVPGHVGIHSNDWTSVGSAAATAGTLHLRRAKTAKRSSSTIGGTSGGSGTSEQPAINQLLVSQRHSFHETPRHRSRQSSLDVNDTCQHLFKVTPCIRCFIFIYKTSL